MPALTTYTPRVFELGVTNEFPITANSIIYEGAAVGDNGSGYATDDNTFTLSVSGATYIGQVSRLETSGKGVVDFYAYAHTPVTP